jgi:hypothetical protein
MTNATLPFGQPCHVLAIFSRIPPSPAAGCSIGSRSTFPGIGVDVMAAVNHVSVYFNF